MPKSKKITAIEVKWKRRAKNAPNMKCKSIIFPTEDQATAETVMSALGFGVRDYSLRFVRVKIKAHPELYDDPVAKKKPAKAQRDCFPGADKKNICHC